MENVIDPQTWLLVYAVSLKLLSTFWPVPVIMTIGYFAHKKWNQRQVV